MIDMIVLYDVGAWLRSSGAVVFSGKVPEEASRDPGIVTGYGPSCVGGVIRDHSITTREPREHPGEPGETDLEA